MKTRLLRLRSAVMPAVVLATLILCLAICPSTALAAFRYSIPKQQDQLTINEDGSVGLVRYFEFAVAENSSDAGTEIWIGLPTSRTAVSSVTDNQGNEVSFETRISGGEYTLILTGFGPIKPGTSKGFAVEALIPDFLFPDSHNEEYVTMKYIPGWWSSEVDVQDIAVILPGAVEKEEIRTGTREWDGIAQTESGAYVVTWHFENLGPNEKVSVNIGFPGKYVALAAKQEPGPLIPSEEDPFVRSPGSSHSDGLWIGIAFAVLAVAFLISIAIAVSRREEYTPPSISMEGIGVNETLSPAEVSVLLRQPPEKTMTLLLFSLIKKGKVQVVSDDPLRLCIRDEADLSEVERLFVDAVDPNTGEPDQTKLVAVFRYLATSVNEKMKPYCRKDTEAFYRGRIAALWDEVRNADTPELKLEKLDRNLLWLIQDEEQFKAAKNMFKAGQDGGKQASWYPTWWLLGFPRVTPYAGFYWWPMMMYRSYTGISSGITEGNEHKYREVEESVFAPARSVVSRPISGGKGSGTRHHGGFTPPSCACACACVSCACACACAGGGGCT
ncbi:MAG: hypothetical protein ACOX35_00905 [Bacillota bacterium]|jgi:hypothetical protein